MSQKLAIVRGEIQKTTTTLSHIRPKTSKENVVYIEDVKAHEDIFAYMCRKYGKAHIDVYRRIIGAANEFKEGDAIQGLLASDKQSRQNARQLIANTKVSQIHENPIYEDDLQKFIWELVDTQCYEKIKDWTIQDVKQFLLEKDEHSIKRIINGLCSDAIACVVKLCSNEELIKISSKIFNPLPGTNLGEKGYLGARIQPNSPTDDVDDIMWQIFSAFSFAVGDVVLGTNPVDSTTENIKAIEMRLKDIVTTFKLNGIIPWCALAHIDIQAQVEKQHKGSVLVYFQSIAGNDSTNKTFDITLQKMIDYANTCDYFYLETGQGSEITNGNGHGVDMVIFESRKYGFAKGIQKITKQKNYGRVFVNDVSGFIGPEVFRNKEQLLRTCLEDLTMGKLHGLLTGLDVCATFHMNISREDLDWCLERLLPAKPGYLMALPTKIDPMLGYLSTSYQDHVKFRHKYHCKVNDKMWDFFKRIKVIDENGLPTQHFGDPVWVYYQYMRGKNDSRSEAAIREEGQQKLKKVISHGVFIPVGYGKNIWDHQPELENRLNNCYMNAKQCLKAEISESFKKSQDFIRLRSQSKNRDDYITYPRTGETLDERSVEKVLKWKYEMESKPEKPNVQILISDGLNANAVTDSEQILPFLQHLHSELQKRGFNTADRIMLLTNGRVRAGKRRKKY